MLFPILIALIAGVALALVYGRLHWKSATKKLRRRIEADRGQGESTLFSESELTDLPPPVQRYFRAALSAGQRMVTSLEIEQTGTFNLDEVPGNWRAFTAIQHVVTRRPGFIWDARIRMFPGVMLRVCDAYIAGEGVLRAAAFGLVSMANLRGAGELARGELMRFLAEAAWYPTALLPSHGVVWSSVDDRSAQATLRDGDITVALLFRFNQDGLIDSFRAEARGRGIGTATTTLPWEGKFWNYARREGMCVPLEGEVAWIHPTGPKPYFRGRFTQFQYDFAP